MGMGMGELSIRGTCEVIAWEGIQDLCKGGREGSVHSPHGGIVARAAKLITCAGVGIGIMLGVYAVDYIYFHADRPGIAKL